MRGVPVKKKEEETINNNVLSRTQHATISSMLTAVRHHDDGMRIKAAAKHNRAKSMTF